MRLNTFACLKINQYSTGLLSVTQWKTQLHKNIYIHTHTHTNKHTQKNINDKNLVNLSNSIRNSLLFLIDKTGHLDIQVIEQQGIDTNERKQLS